MLSALCILKVAKLGGLLMSNDKELLKLAAKAAGIEYDFIDHCGCGKLLIDGYPIDQIGNPWNPLADDADALRLAMKLEMSVEGFPLDGGADVSFNLRGFRQDICERNDGDNYMTATRRAIVQAAATIGQAMGEKK